MTSELGRMTLQALVIGTITGVSSALAQQLVVGEVSPAITASVTAAVTVVLVGDRRPDVDAPPREAAEPR